MMIEGGCLCGQVRFKGEADPFFQAICHCKNCQKQAGSAFSVVVGLPKEPLHLTGELANYADTAESGDTVNRRFCPRCGSGIYSETDKRPGMVILKAGALDDTSWLEPTVHVWTESAMSFTAIPEGVMTFPRNAG